MGELESAQLKTPMRREVEVEDNYKALNYKPKNVQKPISRWQFAYFGITYGWGRFSLISYLCKWIPNVPELNSVDNPVRVERAHETPLRNVANATNTEETTVDKFSRFQA